MVTIEAENVKILNLKENDTIIIKTKENLTNNQFCNIQQELLKIIPEELKNKVNLLILENDIDIEILRKE